MYICLDVEKMAKRVARFHSLRRFHFPCTLSECELSKVFLIIKVRHRDIQPPNKRFLFSDLGYHTNGPCGPPYSEQVDTLFERNVYNVHWRY